MDDRTRLLQDDPSAAINAMQSPVFPVVRVGKYLARDSIGTCTNTIDDNVQIPCQTTFSNAFAAGSQVDIRIVPGFKQGYINRATLMLSIVNNDASNIQLCNVYQMISNIQLLANGGNDLIYQISGDQLWLDTMLMEPAKWENLCVLANTSSTWGTGAVIAAGATATYYLTLTGSLFEQIKLFIHATRGDLILRTQFRPQSVIQQSGAATAVTLSAFNLIFNVVQLDKDSFNKKLVEYQSSPHAFRFLNNVLAYQPSQAFTSGTVFNMKLQSIQGPVSHLIITARDVGETGDGLNDWYSMDDWTFNLLDMAGMPVLGMGLTGKFVRYHEFPEKFTSNMINNKAVYVISFNSKPLISYSDGSQLGYRYFDGEYQLQVTPTATVTKDFYVNAVIYENLYVDPAGYISTTR